MLHVYSRSLPDTESALFFLYELPGLRSLILHYIYQKYKLLDSGTIHDVAKAMARAPVKFIPELTQMGRKRPCV